MSAVNAKQVKELREITGAGMMDCKSALSETGGDLDKAIDFLRKKGLKNVEKRSGKVAAEGSVVSYIHAGGRIGVMLELNCETDFVGKGEDFVDLGRRIAMHIAWSNPKVVSREEISAADIDRETEVLRAQLKPEQGKMADKIISGKLEKYYSEVCLLEQVDAQEEGSKKSIGDIVNEMSMKVGEKITVRRFSRYEVGEGIEKQVVDYAAEVAEAAQV